MPALIYLIKKKNLYHIKNPFPFFLRNFLLLSFLCCGSAFCNSLHLLLL